MLFCLGAMHINVVSDEVIFEGVAGQTRIGANFHFFHDAAAVSADSFFADTEFIRDTL